MSINTHYWKKKKGAPMSRKDILKKRQARLREDISAMLDSFLIGSVGKSPSMSGFNLTTKVQGKTVRKALEMGRRYQRLWKLMQALSKVNWEILNLENQ
jgi:hypothetical protein